MLKKFFSPLLACLLISSLWAKPGIARTQTGRDEERVQKVKAKIAKLRTGSKQRVEIKLNDGTTLKGNIIAINEDQFVVAERNKANQTTIMYTQVKQIKTPDDNPFADRKVWIGISVIPVVLILSFLAKGS